MKVLKTLGLVLLLVLSIVSFTITTTAAPAPAAYIRVEGTGFPGYSYDGVWLTIWCDGADSVSCWADATVY